MRITRDETTGFLLLKGGSDSEVTRLVIELGVWSQDIGMEGALRVRREDLALFVQAGIRVSPLVGGMTRTEEEVKEKLGWV